MWYLPYGEEDIGYKEVPVLPVLVYHSLDHPLQGLLESVDESVCLTVVERCP